MAENSNSVSEMYSNHEQDNEISVVEENVVVSSISVQMATYYDINDVSPFEAIKMPEHLLPFIDKEIVYPITEAQLEGRNIMSVEMTDYENYQSQEQAEMPLDIVDLVNEYIIHEEPFSSYENIDSLLYISGKTFLSHYEKEEGERNLFQDFDIFNYKMLVVTIAFAGHYSLAIILDPGNILNNLCKNTTMLHFDSKFIFTDHSVSGHRFDLVKLFLKNELYKYYVDHRPQEYVTLKFDDFGIVALECSAPRAYFSYESGVCIHRYLLMILRDWAYYQQNGMTTVTLQEVQYKYVSSFRALELCYDKEGFIFQDILNKLRHKWAIVKDRFFHLDLRTTYPVDA